MPSDLGTRIKQAFDEKYLGLSVGVIPRILFSYQFLEQECKDAAFKRSLKNLAFCSQIPIPGYYKEPRKYGIRKSKTYKGKPHDSHARIEKRKHLIRNKKCKCYLCGQEGHFARECPNDTRNVKRVAIFEQLDLPDDCDILSVQEGEAQSDAIYSISEGEEDTEELHRSIQTLSLQGKQYLFMLGQVDGGYRPQIKVSDKQLNCMHEWLDNEVIPPPLPTKCIGCKRQTIQRARACCPKCEITVCNDSMLGRRENPGEHEAMRKMKNEFTVNWDGLQTKDKERVLVLAATNKPFEGYYKETSLKINGKFTRCIKQREDS